MISLLYNRDFQCNLLIALLKDNKFYADSHAMLRLSDFDLPACKLVYEIVNKYYAKYQQIPPFGIMRMLVEQVISSGSVDYETVLQPADYEYMAHVLERIHGATVESAAIPYMRDQLKGYIAYMRLAQVEASGSPAETHIAEVVRLNADLNRVNSGDIEMSPAMQQAKEDDANRFRIGTGIEHIDAVMGGGLERGMTGLIVACSGVGKTNVQLNLCVHTALKKYMTLFITLENLKTSITERFQAMMANIEMGKFNYPKSDTKEWDKDTLARLAWAQHEDFPYRMNMMVGDYSKKTASILDIERMIIHWKTQMVERLGISEDLCLLVCVDWLEKVGRDNLPGVGRTTNDATVFKIIMEQLGEVARRHGVIIWSATQATREATTREVLLIKNTANAIHAHDSVDASFGVAPVISAQDAMNQQKDARPVSDDDIITGRIISPPCDRMLNFCFMKTRHAAGAGVVRSAYQGPTLRIWRDKPFAQRAMTLAKSGKMDEYIHYLTVPSFK